jgi:SAM-dependent methyltransferase
MASWRRADSVAAPLGAAGPENSYLGTDRDWERWGAADPYFGVFSSAQYRATQLNAQAIDDFFNSGKQHVARVLDAIHESFDASYDPHRVLDFGCGVGRLVVPFSRIADRVVGVDISKSMLAEAAANCTRRSITNTEFVLSDDHLSRVTDRFDLVHSFIVLQHIPWRRGQRILQCLMQRVEPGGYLCFQFLTSCLTPTLRRALVRLRYAFPPLNWARNVILRRSVFEPPMQLHVYPIPPILHDLASMGFGKAVLVVEPPTAEFEFESTLLFARRLA